MVCVAGAAPPAAPVKVSEAGVADRLCAAVTVSVTGTEIVGFEAAMELMVMVPL